MSNTEYIIGKPVEFIKLGIQEYLIIELDNEFHSSEIWVAYEITNTREKKALNSAIGSTKMMRVTYDTANIINVEHYGKTQVVFLSNVIEDFHQGQGNDMHLVLAGPSLEGEEDDLTVLINSIFELFKEYEHCNPIFENHTTQQIQNMFLKSVKTMIDSSTKFLVISTATSLKNIFELANNIILNETIKEYYNIQPFFMTNEQLNSYEDGYVLLPEAILFNPRRVTIDITVTELKNLEGFINNYYMTPALFAEVQVCANTLQSGLSRNIVALGPSGSGKTTWAKSVAQYTAELLQTEVGFVHVQGTRMAEQTPETWFIHEWAKGGSTGFTFTQFAEALLSDVPHIILIDEFNRVPTYAHNALYNVLDDTKMFEIHGVPYEITTPHIFIFTTNIGLEYAGTDVMDAAIINRMDCFLKFHHLPEQVEFEILNNACGNLPFNTEQKLVNIVKIMREIRKFTEQERVEFDVTIRTMMLVAKGVGAGYSIRQAIDTALITRLVAVDSMSNNIAKGIIDIINLHS